MTEKNVQKSLLDSVIDKKLLEERRQKSENKRLNSTANKEEKTYQEYDKWNNMLKKNFTKKRYNEKYYARYSTWPKRSWIGPYDTEKEIDTIIDSYVRETKKSIQDRNIENIHSIVIDLE